MDEGWTAFVRFMENYVCARKLLSVNSGWTRLRYRLKFVQKPMAWASFITSASPVASQVQLVSSSNRPAKLFATAER